MHRRVSVSSTPHSALSHKSIPWLATFFRQSSQIRKGASFCSTIIVAVLAVLRAISLGCLLHLSFECEQTFHGLFLSPSDFIQDGRGPGPIITGGTEDTMCTCSAILDHFTLHGASLPLLFFHISPPSLARTFQPFLQTVLRSSGLIESVSENLDFSQIAVCVAPSAYFLDLKVVTDLSGVSAKSHHRLAGFGSKSITSSAPGASSTEKKSNSCPPTYSCGFDVLLLTICQCGGPSFFSCKLARHSPGSAW